MRCGHGRCGFSSGSFSVFLYLPLIPPLVQSVQGVRPGEWTLWLVWRTFAHAADRPAPPGIGNGRADRRRRSRQCWVSSPRCRSASSAAAPHPAAMLLPLFIPGVSMGLASAFLFRLLGIAPIAATIVIVQIAVGAALRDADHPHRDVGLRSAISRGRLCGRRRALAGLSRHRAAADRALAFLARRASRRSCRSTRRQDQRRPGTWNTIPTYVWSTYRQVGLSPVLYALMGLIIMATVAIVVAYLLLSRPVRRQ